MKICSISTSIIFFQACWLTGECDSHTLLQREQVWCLIHDFTASGASAVINMLLTILVPNMTITLFSNENHGLCFMYLGHF